MKRYVHLFLLAGIAAIMLPVTGCSSVTAIGEITANPSTYQSDVVSIKGTVGETVWLPALKKGAYQVGDQTGTIWVVTSQPPPQQGASALVKGTVETAVIIGDRTFGTVVRESERR